MSGRSLDFFFSGHPIDRGDRKLGRTSPQFGREDLQHCVLSRSSLAKTKKILGFADISHVIITLDTIVNRCLMYCIYTLQVYATVSTYDYTTGNIALLLHVLQDLTAGSLMKATL